MRAVIPKFTSVKQRNHLDNCFFQFVSIHKKTFCRYCLFFGIQVPKNKSAQSINFDKINLHLLSDCNEQSSFSSKSPIKYAFSLIALKRMPIKAEKIFLCLEIGLETYNVEKWIQMFLSRNLKNSENYFCFGVQ